MRTTTLSLALVLLLGIGVAAAEEIVFFTNGTTMPVRGHEIEGEMIRVDLGPDGWLAFPRTQVERIESAGREVFPSTAGPANRIVDGAGTRSYPVTGRRPGRYNRATVAVAGAGSDPALGTDPSGIPVYQPFAYSGNAAARKIGVTGHSAAIGGNADASGNVNSLRRTHQIGGSQRYDRTGNAGGGKPKLTGFARAPQATGSSGGSSAGGSGGSSSGASTGGDGG